MYALISSDSGQAHFSYVLITQAFTMCHVSEISPFNLLQKSLTSPVVLQVLKQLSETDPAFWQILTQNKTIPLEVKHSDYDDAEDYNPNEENSVLKYEDDHSIPSDVLHNHILYGNVTQHEGLECEKGNIVPLSISKTINNDAADTEHDFEDLNKEISPLALKAQSRVDGQVPTK